MTSWLTQGARPKGVEMKSFAPLENNLINKVTDQVTDLVIEDLIDEALNRLGPNQGQAEGAESGLFEADSGLDGPKSGLPGPNSGLPDHEPSHPGPDSSHPGFDSGHPGPDSGHPGPDSNLQEPGLGLPGPGFGVPGPDLAQEQLESDVAVPTAQKVKVTFLDEIVTFKRVKLAPVRPQITESDENLCRELIQNNNNALKTYGDQFDKVLPSRPLPDLPEMS